AATLGRGVVGIAPPAVESEARQLGGLVGRHRRQRFANAARQRLDTLLEALDLDDAVLVVEGGEDLGQRPDRVGDGPTVHPRVKVAPGTPDLELHGRQAPRPYRHRRNADAVDTAVGADGEVGSEHFTVLLEELGQVGAADLLFPFDEEGQVYGRQAAVGGVSLHRLDGDEHAALIVTGAAAVDLAVADLGFEGLRVP